MEQNIWHCPICGQDFPGDQPPERCPICGAECWESKLAREAMGTEPNITAACTSCALQGKRRSTYR